MLKVLDQAREDNAETTAGVAPTLDEVARKRARDVCWRSRWRKRLRTTSRRMPTRATQTAGGWSCATAVRNPHGDLRCGDDAGACAACERPAG